MTACPYRHHWAQRSQVTRIDSVVKRTHDEGLQMDLDACPRSPAAKWQASCAQACVQQVHNRVPKGDIEEVRGTTWGSRATLLTWQFHSVTLMTANQQRRRIPRKRSEVSTPPTNEGNAETSRMVRCRFATWPPSKDRSRASEAKAFGRSNERAAMSLGAIRAHRR